MFELTAYCPNCFQSNDDLTNPFQDDDDDDELLLTQKLNYNALPQDQHRDRQ